MNQYAKLGVKYARNDHKTLQEFKVPPDFSSCIFDRFVVVDISYLIIIYIATMD